MTAYSHEVNYTCELGMALHERDENETLHDMQTLRCAWDQTWQPVPVVSEKFE